MVSANLPIDESFLGVLGMVIAFVEINVIFYRVFFCISLTVGCRSGCRSWYLEIMVSVNVRLH